MSTVVGKRSTSSSTTWLENTTMPTSLAENRGCGSAVSGLKVG